MIESVASSPGMTLKRIAVWYADDGDECERQQGPADRTEVVHRPFEAVGPAIGACRDDVGQERVPSRNADPSRHPGSGAEDADLQGSSREADRRGEDRRRRVAADCHFSASNRIIGERPSGHPRNPGRGISDPSIKPSAAAGAPRVSVRNEGRSAVGTSWPRSASRLAPPISATPRFNQGGSSFASSSLLEAIGRLYAGERAVGRGAS